MILEEQELEYCSAGSTTFNNEAMGQVVEADTCFYIEHEADVRGRSSIDLAVDPPPDLAIEIDLTVWTRLPNPELLGVPELWRYDRVQALKSMFCSKAVTLQQRGVGISLSCP